MALMLSLALLSALSSAETISFRLVNNCSSQRIWPAMQRIVEPNTTANPMLDPLPAGLSLRPGTSVQTKPLPLPWGGRIWARQFCSESGTNCLIGDCSGSSCWLNSGKSSTLFEVHANENDTFYNLSLGMCTHTPPSFR